MEKVYRGYPLETMETKPYMIYNREIQKNQPDIRDTRRYVQNEYEYFRGLYPMAVKKWQRFVEEEMERSDVPGNMIYDEYPDRERLYMMRDRIMNNAGALGGVESRDVILILMLHEMLQRRLITRKFE